MLKAKKNDFSFNKGKVQFLTTNNYKEIIENYGHAILCDISTIGYGRFYQAKQAGISADFVIQIPIIYKKLTNKDLVEFSDFNDPESYICKIVQVQELINSMPPCLQLTLQKEKQPYADKRND